MVNTVVKMLKIWTFACGTVTALGLSVNLRLQSGDRSEGTSVETLGIQEGPGWN